MLKWCQNKTTWSWKILKKSVSFILIRNKTQQVSIQDYSLHRLSNATYETVGKLHSFITIQKCFSHFSSNVSTRILWCFHNCGEKINWSIGTLWSIPLRFFFKLWSKTFVLFKNFSFIFKLLKKYFRIKSLQKSFYYKKEFFCAVTLLKI